VVFAVVGRGNPGTVGPATVYSYVTDPSRGVDGSFRPNAGITVEPLGDGTRSRVTIALDFEGSGIGKLLPLEVIRRMTAKSAPKSYRNLKDGSNAGANTHRKPAAAGPCRRGGPGRG
jgi:hypothetical protein